ncbi:MAG: bifunctional proline dehydrogenase/L-glutamate gamma-semialdehyde dehydrogenase PutA, partial [Rhodobacteraceae bacterium]|nr:bifunctional proline dehydrogenase/L-glutamate gamma-semialdehyde dehydrogenase PutA [Paracoccaceae bacterium]
MSDKRRAMVDDFLAARRGDSAATLDRLRERFGLDAAVRSKISADAELLVSDIRSETKPSVLDAMLVEYGLGTEEGLALLRVAEALMRVPDAATMDALIADKIVPVDWKRHRGKSPSRLVNAATLALQATAYCLSEEGQAGSSGWFRRALRTASTPLIRVGVRQATAQLAGRFVLGRTMKQAMRSSRREARAGNLFSYDMLGEAAITQKDADFFFDAYKSSIGRLAPKCKAADFRANDGISIKLSALHPRYELTQRGRVLKELTARVSELSRMAKHANIGLNIDAEEADRLEISLEVIEAVLREKELEGWDGFGVVVQAYGKAAPFVIDWLYELACELDRRLMVRLVKGAYWDSEVKRAQVEGLEDFPVYTHKAETDVSYLCCARKLLSLNDRIYTQFAGHNAHTVSAILELAEAGHEFEFQRIHGMGKALHDKILEREGTRCRIYAPVGEYRELLPYLARRLLENGANSSFVNQIANAKLEAASIAADPFDALRRTRAGNVQPIEHPRNLFGYERKNSRGWDLHDSATLKEIGELRQPFRSSTWTNSEYKVGGQNGEPKRLSNPGNPQDDIGATWLATRSDVDDGLKRAVPWDVPASERAQALLRASDLYESDAGQMFALLCREAGKTLSDAIAELREAVDFLRYYSAEALRYPDRRPSGLAACISPWNFPLAIFTGQIAGALAAGNGVVAKPAGQTPLTATLAVRKLHEAGVPREALQLFPGKGSEIGNALVSDPRVSVVAFTGSTDTAGAINRTMARHLKLNSRLVAETGGLNVMVVDSTALPEQVVRDIVVSGFQSAGQRCSALRVLYLQEDVHGSFLEMLYGVMDELVIGDPWEVRTDVGPMIDEAARDHVQQYVDRAGREGRLLKQCQVPEHGWYCGPAAIRVSGIEDVHEEIFGPVLHVASYRSSQLQEVIKAVNSSGYGLTFGLHSRVDARVRQATRQLRVGNIYVNRNQIGAVVGSQPFGGEGLSGTGPKAGGPHYVKAFSRSRTVKRHSPPAREVSAAEVQALLDVARQQTPTALDTLEMPGPTGESNRLGQFARGTVLCLGPREVDAQLQADVASSVGCSTVRVAAGAKGDNAISGVLPRSQLTQLEGIDVVVLWSDETDQRAARIALSERDGQIVPLVTTDNLVDFCTLERHVCVDTTAAGGNAALFEVA